MSQENIEAVERALDAFNRRDIEAYLEELHPEVEFRVALQGIPGGAPEVYRGHDGIRAQLRDLHGAFAEFHLEITELRDLGERVVAIGQLRGRGKESGAPVESPIGYVVDFKDGKAIRLDDYFDPDEALEAAGLRE